MKKEKQFKKDIYFCFIENTKAFDCVQLSSVAQSCPTLCDPMNCSTPGLPVDHHLLGFTQTHVHWAGDAIQPPHPLSSPSTSCLQPFPASGSFQMSSSSHQVAKVLEFQLQHQSFQWIPRTGIYSFRMDWLDLFAVQGTLKNLLQHQSSKESVFWHSVFFLVQLSHPYMKWSEVKSLSCVRLFATPWTVAHQAPPSMGFTR